MARSKRSVIEPEIEIGLGDKLVCALEELRDAVSLLPSALQPNTISPEIPPLQVGDKIITNKQILTIPKKKQMKD